jgi:enoyl-CoA hydratase/carnithine racemase
MSANPQSEQPLVLREVRDGVCTLTLNRPQARNALSVAMMESLQSELDAIREDRDIRVVVVAANGPAFCAGHDLKEMRANPQREFYEALFEQCSRLMVSIIELPQPVIARIHGIATAAGCQLVATCDLAVAADTVRFATPGVNIGLFCSTPMVALSRAVSRKHAMEMLLTGDMIDANRAFEIGLINRVVEPEALEPTVDELAQKMVGKSPLTLAIGKEAFYRQAELGIDGAYEYCSEVMTRNMLARDAAEGIDAFLEKRKPEWRGE